MRVAPFAPARRREVVTMSNDNAARRPHACACPSRATLITTQSGGWRDEHGPAVASLGGVIIGLTRPMETRCRARSRARPRSLRWSVVRTTRRCSAQLRQLRACICFYAARRALAGRRPERRACGVAPSISRRPVTAGEPSSAPCYRPRGKLRDPRRDLSAHAAPGVLHRLRSRRRGACRFRRARLPVDPRVAARSRPELTPPDRALQRRAR